MDRPAWMDEEPMTQAEWSRCTDGNRLLEFLDGRVSERKLRLFASACCRRIPALVQDPECRRLIELAERQADGLADPEEILTGEGLARDRLNALADHGNALQLACAHTIDCLFGRFSREQAAWAYAYCCCEPRTDPYRFGRERGQELKAQLSILRHMTGNPFETPVNTGKWSLAEIDLAQALYAGEPCHFALHDALLDAGHAELAAHFREPGHPKGCWALDLILGKS